MPNDDNPVYLAPASDGRPSAVECYTNARIAQLTKQRDDLALCLHDFVQGFERGHYVAAAGWFHDFLDALNRAQAALLNNEVLHRLETDAGKVRDTANEE